ncbi:hypothetical protein ANCDUO_13979 [Ancylostoma duodenale]|uniref:Uncharacterized protein n=1 Tax=Ancylostoma duodenale TaxID=51022 RepID=A0A0C2GAB7_9BILA|nr:hypothetical protein ANCDUO_13979 [Ancylostoma duodenale]
MARRSLLAGSFVSTAGGRPYRIPRPPPRPRPAARTGDGRQPCVNSAAMVGKHTPNRAGSMAMRALFEFQIDDKLVLNRACAALCCPASDRR